ncbi:MAG: hypothetical protein N3G21_11665 [Candidatus Hydrogenedentes bacterium]|nr:hypothetical protein [Candidatus Hydrogenedentota bacterium]
MLITITFIIIPHIISQTNNLHTKGEEIININNRREIFVDYFLIDKLINAELKINTPHPRECVLKFDKPWEGKYSGYVTLIKDGNLYRLYYRGLPTSGKDGSTNEVTCYAESFDGINFTKPDLGIYSVMGTKNNNVILANDPPFSHNFAPFLDTKPGIPASERYKAIAGTFDSGLYAFVSDDGIHWEKMCNEPILKGYEFDSLNVAFWSDSENKYVLYFRTWNGPENKYRWISKTTSGDFIHWEKPTVMEKGKAPWEHIYTNQTLPYFRAPQIYISLCGRFVPGCNALEEEELTSLNVEKDYAYDCSDVILMSSRGGNIYNRIFLEAFLKPEPGPENWVSRANFPVRGIVQANEYEMAIYIQKHYALPSGHIQRYTLRLDAFTSISAGFNEGYIYTKPFRFSGKQISLNFATSATGYVLIEIQDEKGNTILPFSYENCIPLKGNKIEKVIKWKDKKDILCLDSRTIRLCFKMKDAEIYSINFN